MLGDSGDAQHAAVAQATHLPVGHVVEGQYVVHAHAFVSAGDIPERLSGLHGVLDERGGLELGFHFGNGLDRFDRPCLLEQRPVASEHQDEKSPTHSRRR